ncbi:MAG: hypothetical protein QXD48_03415 [Candidatus Aenigmatarchaeota archaeon]
MMKKIFTITILILVIGFFLSGYNNGLNIYFYGYKPYYSYYSHGPLISIRTYGYYGGYVPTFYRPTTLVRFNFWTYDP